MKIKGTLLKFDTINSTGDMFSKDCIISIPDKVPICYNFREIDPDYILGSVVVTREDDGLYIVGEIHGTYVMSEDVIKNELTKTHGLGGTYEILNKSINDNNVTLIDESKLIFVNIVEKPVNPGYTFEIID